MKSNPKLRLTVISDLFSEIESNYRFGPWIASYKAEPLSKKASMRIKLWFDYSAQLGFLLERNHLQQNLFGEC